MRIRSIKPEYLRHELLQELEQDYPESKVMLVFQGLWMASDSLGDFEWKPRMLKLDILPFIDYDIDRTMGILSAYGFIRKYSANGKQYGQVVAFNKHQRLSGKEVTEGVKYPQPTGEALEENREAPEKRTGSTYEATEKHPKNVSSVQITTPKGNEKGKHPGSAGEATGKHPGAQEGKGKEEEGKGNSAGQAVAIVPDPDAELYQAINAAFLAKNNERFTSYAKEGQAIKGIIAKAKIRSADDPAGFAQSMLEAFWKLKTGGDKFWTGQPFLPSALNAGGIWDRVLETMRSDEVDDEFNRILAGAMGLKGA